MTTDELTELIEPREFVSFSGFKEWAVAFKANKNLQVAKGLLHCALSLPEDFDPRPIKTLVSIVEETAFDRKFREKALHVIIDRFLAEDDAYEGRPFGAEAIKSCPGVLPMLLGMLCDNCNREGGFWIPESRLKTVRWFLCCCNRWLRTFDRTRIRRELEDHRALLLMVLIQYGLGEEIRSIVSREISDAARWFVEIQHDVDSLRAIACRFASAIDTVLAEPARTVDDRVCLEAALHVVALERVYQARVAAFSLR